MDLNDIARRIRRGDKDALRGLVEAYGGDIYKRALNRCGDADLAKEATRQTFRQIVTGLQTSEDENGWRLWIDMLTKANIQTYSMIATDISIMETQLEEELFPEKNDPALPAKKSAPPRVLNPVSAQVPILAPPEERSTPMHASPERGAPATPEFWKEDRQEANAFPASPVVAKGEEEPADGQPESEGIIADPQMQLYDIPRPAPSLPERKNRQNSDRRQNSEASREQHKRNEGAHAPRASAGRTLGIVGLILFCCLLVWVILGISMSMGLIPKFELGYNWFNQYIFKLF